MKWPGGKTAELPAILAHRPPGARRVVEPFVGGGAVFLACAGLEAAVNDASGDLMAVYRAVKEQDPPFFEALSAIARAWTAAGRAAGRLTAVRAWCEGGEARLDAALEAVPADVEAVEADLADPLSGVAAGAPLSAHLARALSGKLRRMARLEAERGRLPPDHVTDNLEAAVRSAVYVALREAYNADAPGPGPGRAARFLFLRETAYAAMFRYNQQGGFNVPYGGISYNRRDLAARFGRLRDPALVERLGRTTLSCDDFEAFLDRLDPGPEDWIFLDPPYDSDFSTYAGRTFGEEAHRRLAAWLQRAPDRVPFLLVVRETPLMEALYRHPAWTVTHRDKLYPWTIKGRNDRRAVHRLVTNRPAGPGAA